MNETPKSRLCTFKIRELLIKTCELNEISPEDGLTAMSTMITQVLAAMDNESFEAWKELVEKERIRFMEAVKNEGK